MNNFQINLLVRAKNRAFWIAFIPAIILLLQTVCNLFGIKIDLALKEGQILDVMNAVFGLLAVLGVIADPTTKGISDSDSAMKYEEPKEG